MAALLSARAKTVAAAIPGVALALAALWLALVPPRAPDTLHVQARVEKDCQRMETALSRRVQECLRRSEGIAAAFASGRLDASAMEGKEALVVERDGIISDYAGVIYFFKPQEQPVGEWRLVRRNQDIYFQRRVGPHTHYLRFFMDLGQGDRNLVRQAARLRYPVFELRFSAHPLAGGEGEFSYDQAQKRFYANRVFQAAQQQLVLSLVFTSSTLERHSLRQRKIVAHVLAFLLLLGLFLFQGRGARPRTALRLLLLAAMAAASWGVIEWLGKRDLYFTGHPNLVRSIFQLLALLSCLLLALRLLRKQNRMPHNALALAVFNIVAAAAFFAIDAVLGAVDFPFGDFSLRPEYLGLLAVLIGLHAAPLLAAAPFSEAATRCSAWPFLLMQAALVAAAWRWLHFPPLAFLLLALAFLGLLLPRRRSWTHAIAPLLLLALASSIWLGQYSLRRTKSFIRENLKPVFSSQDDYAKLVAREVVYELNSQNVPFSAFFYGQEGGDLAGGWMNTLAAREDIASGIHVVAGDGTLLHSFSYQIPYIPLNKRDIFPFWHVEDEEAELFGKRVRLAVARISVSQEGRYLGYIMVQVLNTAELVLKGREPQSVLEADRRLRHAGIGYIKLDEAGRILENPANMNVPGLAALARTDNAWVAFSSMGIAYEGGVFQTADGATIIFFPRGTFFRMFSEFVKVLGFLLLLAALVNLRQLRRFPWRFVFNSFSVKVFAILVLLSILTASVFSLFSLNFNALSQETRRSQAAHRRGRSALALVNNLLSAGNEITQSHIFLLEKILETDISVYEAGTLLYTSDQRQLIRSELPAYLDSRVRDRLRRDNQQFELLRGGEALELFFQGGGEYVFRMEFPAETAEQLRARRYFFDFMVTLFFVLIFVGLAAAFFFRDKILAPIHRLNNGMAAVQRGVLKPLDNIPAEVELRELYQGFNSMLEGIQEQKRSASEIARMKTLVQLGRRVAHEVKNPLTPIRLSAEQIQRSLRDDDASSRQVIADAVRYIIEETEHLRRVAFGFLNLSKLDEVKSESFRLDELVGDAVARLQPLYPRVDFSLARPGEGIAVVADRQKIKQAIDNVLTNAVEAVAGRGGTIAVDSGQEGELAWVRVSDDGEGIGPEDLERIAREEFSSKDLGTGLGLVIARRFLELHRGGLEIDSSPGRGTTVVMRFASHVPQA